MATTAIWKITKRLDHVLDYTTNVEKTKYTSYSEETYKDLHNVLEYIEDDFKTEEQLYVTGINCSPSIAYEEMKITKEEYGKTDGILGFHAFQSFKEGEVTPDMAHEVGIKLAEEMWGDRFEVVVSTHLNSHVIHNHFVINSVSFKDGKRYYDKRETLAELRSISDSLCEEYGLSVIKEKPCRNSKINFENYLKLNIQRDNYYTIAKKDLDRAIAMAYTYQDFENLMKAMDYELIYRANKLSIKRKPYKKNIRIERYFGENYSINKIKERIEIEHTTRIPFVEEYGLKKFYSNKNVFKQQKKKGIYALYLHYCYLLGVFPKNKSYQKLPASMRADVERMDQLSKEIKLLATNNLETDEQFFLFKKEKETLLNDLMDKRSKLWYQHKKSQKTTDKESILKQIEKINEQLKPIKEEVVLCDDIEERLPKIEKNLQEVEKQGKEVKKDEHIK